MTLSIETISPAPWLEVFSWWAQIVITIVATVAAGVGWHQLKAMNAAIHSQNKTLNATLLMELDKQWDSESMVKARTLFKKIHAEITNQVSKENLILQDGVKRAKILSAWADKLNKIQKDSTEEYSSLMRMCGFFETVGLMEARGYIHAPDVIGLLKGPLINIGCFEEHITQLAQQIGVPHGLYEHALNLSRLAHQDG